MICVPFFFPRLLSRRGNFANIFTQVSFRSQPPPTAPAGGGGEELFVYFGLNAARALRPRNCRPPFCRRCLHIRRRQWPRRENFRTNCFNFPGLARGWTTITVRPAAGNEDGWSGFFEPANRAGFNQTWTFPARKLGIKGDNDDLLLTRRLSDGSFSPRRSRIFSVAKSSRPPPVTT